MADLTGRTALVTGAARRLGRGIALALAREGVNVIVHHRGPSARAGEVLQELTACGVRSWSIEAELADPARLESVIPRALECAGALDILVNNASIFLPGTLSEITLESLEQQIRANTWAPFALTREFARRVGKGKVVNLLDSRISGYDWNHVAYILSKHLLSILTRMTAVEYAPDLAVNAVAPGLILPPPGKDENYLEELAAGVPLKRPGSIADVTSAVIYLLKSDYLTGQTINVDGGRHAVRYDK
jgi:pteridine reductase